MTRRRWLIAAHLLILFVAAYGAAVEFAGLRADGGSSLPLLAWVAVWVIALALLAAQFFGATGNASRVADLENVVDVLPVGLSLHDSAGKLRHSNKAFRQAFADQAVDGDIDGDHELADGRWMRMWRSRLTDGGSAIMALDISQIVALEEDLRHSRRRFNQFLGAAADWIWETDVLHRFSTISRVEIDADNGRFDWMIGRSLAELAGGGEDADERAADDCLRAMGLGDRLRDVRLVLYNGSRAIPVRLAGVPLHDRKGIFLGYQGVGLWDDSMAPPGIPVERITPAAADRPGGRLLVVDDTSSNRALAKSILSKMGYEVDAVEGGPQAIEAVRTGGYAAVLMDIRMPDMDGFEATAAIRELPPPRGNLPIIAMTAHTGADERRRCLKAGMEDHVGKPIDRGALAAVLRRLVGTPPGASARDARGGRTSDKPDPVDLVNDGVLEQLRNDAGPALVNELIAAYMAETDERLVRFGAAIMAGALDDIGADAHSMKSSSGTFGALALQVLSATLEGAAMRGDATAVTAALDQLPELVSKTWREFAMRGYRPDRP